MKCPFCGSNQDKVVDSRSIKDGEAIRRRRLCMKCGQRFTSYERVEDPMPLVVKKDGTREFFDRNKLLNGLKKACEKRPISAEQLDELVNEIEKKLVLQGQKEIASSFIGEEVMNRLREIDKVAYVRFASVYRQFKDINELMLEVKGLFEKSKK